MSWLGALLSIGSALLTCLLAVYFYERQRRQERRLFPVVDTKDLKEMILGDARESLNIRLRVTQARLRQAQLQREQYEAKRLDRRLIALFQSVKAPSFSQWMVRGAVRRLPLDMSEAEKARWASEMAADVASVPGRLRRLRYAFGVWRKGAPKMPVAGAGAPRSAD